MPPSKGMLRIAVAIAWVVLASAFVLRSAFVSAYSAAHVERAERVWPGHPSVLSARAILNVARSTSHGRSLDQETRAMIEDIARAEPLAPEPYLIAGAEAQKNNDLDRAERLLLEARQRDPRGRATRFLLAELYVSQGRIREGVPETAALGRLVPGSAEPLSKAFARYIETAGVPEGMGEVMRSNPGLSHSILGELSTKASNADLLLKIAALAPRTPGPAPGWQTRLINELVEGGDYRRARQVWAQLGGREPDPTETIHDPRFEGSDAPAPFNWTLATEGAVIERQDGSLHILYFGRNDVTLATQLLVLQPGRYRLQMSVSGAVAKAAVRWRIGCLPDKSIVLDRPIEQAGEVDAMVEVPARGCGAQQLALLAQAGESAASSDFAISGLSLTAAR